MTQNTLRRSSSSVHASVGWTSLSGFINALNREADGSTVS